MTLLEAVADLLSRQRVPHALIGAAALAAHGVSRSTVDQDLLVTDVRVLDAQFWSSLPDASADVRWGDADDPLAGVVRIASPPERNIDVIVGRHRWESDIIDRASPMGSPFPIVQRGDLVLLKLYAGGLQDRWDIEQILALDGHEDVIRHVNDHIESLPRAAADLWGLIRDAR